MGGSGALVRGIFFRNKSYDFTNGRSNPGERKRWSSVRSYLCGDEFSSVLAVDDSRSVKDSDTFLSMSQQLSQPFDSVLATEDSASVKHLEEEEEECDSSVKSSEATVTQPLLNSSNVQVTETHQTYKLSLQEDAAVIIQSAFRSYLAIRRCKQVEETFVKEEMFSVKGRRKRVSANRTTLQKNKSQALIKKEDWDDSTVSSTISKRRIQSRMEAMTKRERALAYAFSQQLRICSKKKQTDRGSDTESNIGWSWLERWMATRVPDNNIQTDAATKNQGLVTKNRPFGVGGELESCASNDIPLQFQSISETLTEDFQTEKSGVKGAISKGKSVLRHNKLHSNERGLQRQTKKARKATTTPSSSQISALR